MRLAGQLPELHRGEDNGRLRDECLIEHEFWSLAHARMLLERFRTEYSTEHLPSSLGYVTPEEYAAAHPVGAA